MWQKFAYGESRGSSSIMMLQPKELAWVDLVVMH